MVAMHQEDVVITASKWKDGLITYEEMEGWYDNLQYYAEEPGETVPKCRATSSLNHPNREGEKTNVMFDEVDDVGMEKVDMERV